MKQPKLLALLAIFFNINVSKAQTCIGPRAATIEVSEAVTGSNASWTPLTNAKVSDNVYDIVALPNLGFSNRLKLTGFGFTLPTNAIISGITVEVEKSVTGGVVIRDKDIMIVKAGVTQTATNKAVTTPWTSVDAISTYGSNTDLWANTWTGADINNAGFGVAISAERNINAGAPQDARIDFVRITVCYSGLLVLPVKLKNFQTSLFQKNKVNVTWTTLNEENIKWIEIEKSATGNNFESFQKIPPKGNGSSSENTYSVIDNTCFNGTNFYRIKFLDNDGQITYSDIKTEVISNIEKISMQYNESFININISDKPNNYLLKIFDTDGKLVFSKSIITNTENTFVKIPVDLKKGNIVFATIASNNNTVSKKLFIY
jgi:hypothetical protein